MTAYAKAALAAALFAAGLAVGWVINGWRGDAALSDLKAAHAGLVSAANAASAAWATAAQQRYAALVSNHAKIDAEQTAALGKERDETQRLRDCVARGTCGLRVAAVCPARAPDVPGAAPAAGVGDAGAPGLTEDARRNYYALRDGIAAVTRQLTACQQMSAPSGR